MARPVRRSPSTPIEPQPINPNDGVVATQPVAFMRNGVKPIVRLRFANGGELRCTPNHRIWTSNRGYVPADELTERGTRLSERQPDPCLIDAKLGTAGEGRARSRSRSLGVVADRSGLPDRWSEGLGELTGHLIGDGWLTDVQTGWVYGRRHPGWLGRRPRGAAQRADRRSLTAGDGQRHVQLGPAARRCASSSAGSGYFRRAHRQARAPWHLHCTDRGAGRFPAGPVRCRWMRLACRGRRQG